jgi:hypothetical protein
MVGWPARALLAPGLWATSHHRRYDAARGGATSKQTHILASKPASPLGRYGATASCSVTVARVCPAGTRVVLLVPCSGRRAIAPMLLGARTGAGHSPASKPEADDSRERRWASAAIAVGARQCWLVAWLACAALSGSLTSRFGVSPPPPPTDWPQPNLPRGPSAALSWALICIGPHLACRRLSFFSSTNHLYAMGIMAWHTAGD